jgi:hypothetical protein
MAPKKVVKKAALSPPQGKSKKKADPWWKVLLAFLLKAGLAFAGALLPVLIGFGVAWLKTKLKFDKVAGLEDTLNKWVDLGIEYAEQQASKIEGGGSNNSKLKLACDFVLKMVEAAGLPDKVADLVEDRIEARLKMVKNGVSK